jgi:hypothetical protein
MMAKQSEFFASRTVKIRRIGNADLLADGRNGGANN